MKKLPALSFYAIACAITLSSCVRNHDSGLSLTYTESDDYYSMNAEFSKSKTRAVERYMESKIGQTTKTPFTSARIDGTVALDDQTTFYMKKSPGTLKIKLDKDENSEEALEKIRSMCEGLKGVLSK